MESVRELFSKLTYDGEFFIIGFVLLFAFMVVSCLMIIGKTFGHSVYNFWFKK